MISSVAAKFRGCLIGSHVGDCLGSPFEGTEHPVSKSVLRNYFNKKLNDSSDTGKQSPIHVHPYTDDTAMTLAMAKSLIANGIFVAKDMGKRFVEEYFEHPRRGYGMNVVDVFKALRDSDCQDIYGPAKRQFGGAGSYGNGAAMRIAPVALYCFNRENEISKIAKESALITHAHQNGYNGAILQCFAIHQALKTSPETKINPIKFTKTLLEKMEELEEPIPDVGSLENSKPYCSSLEKIIEIFEKSKKMTSQAVAEDLGNYVSAHKSVPTAIYSFLRSFEPLDDFESENPFVRAIYFAVSVGGDTDTIAAMTGSISGAYHGNNLIPEQFERTCEAIEESSLAADNLFSLSCGG